MPLSSEGGERAPDEGTTEAPPGRGHLIREFVGRRWVQHAGAYLLYQLLWLMMMGPWILPHFTDGILSTRDREASVFVWAVEWWPHALTQGSNPLLSPDVWAPTGLNLAWVATAPGPSLAVAPFTMLFGPVASFNLLSLIGPPLTAWTAYLLARHVTGALAAALAGGFLFGFSPVVIREIEQGHLNLSMLFLLPLAAYLILRRLDRTMSRRRFVVLFTAVLVGEFSIFTETFATMAIVMFLVGLASLLLAPPHMRSPLLDTGALVALAFMLAAVVVSPYLYTAFAYPDALKPEGFSGLAAGADSVRDLRRYVVPGRGFLIGPGNRPGRPADINFWYFGIPLLFVLAAFFVQNWRRFHARILMFGLLASLVLALGSGLQIGGARVPLPWGVFADLPLIGRARPGRIVAYAFLFASVSAAMWVAKGRASRSPLRWVLLAAAVLSLLPNFLADIWVMGVRSPPFVSTGLYRQYLCPGEIVMVVAPRTEQVYWQAESGMYFRTVGWYPGFRPEDYPDLPLSMRLQKGRVPTDGSEVTAFMAEHRVSAIIATDRGRATEAARQLAAILRAPSQPIGGVVLVRVSDCPPEPLAERSSSMSCPYREEPMAVRPQGGNENAWAAAPRCPNAMQRDRPVTGDGGHADRVDVGKLYRHRFSAEDLEFKRHMWDVLCGRFFQRYVRETDTVLDLGAGTCEFINAIRCGDKIVVDVNPDVALHARDATVVLAPATAMTPIASGSVDVVFCSNFFEHLPHKTAVLQTLDECRRVMRPGGTLIILQPNIRYLSGRYWDYFDHHLAFTHLSMLEALDLRGFVGRRVIPRFLPYTVKNTWLPKSTVLLRAYLRVPLLWPLLGRQMLIIAEREPNGDG